MTGLVVDLNADVGESFGRWRLGEDEAILDVVTSANVACGFHAGDPLTLRKTCAAAIRRGVRVGAQVSYPDLAGFGRRFMDVTPADLAADVIYQLGALDGMARAAGGRVSYVKPHGALYHEVTRHVAQASAVVDAVRDYDGSLPILGPPGSELLRLAADAGLPTVVEAFADRAYAADGTLVGRDQPGAVLTDPAQAAEQALRLARDGEVVAVDGTVVRLRARSICLHGDTPDAAANARAIRDALVRAGVELTPFATALG